ncbi:MAG: hypothetical protein ACRCX7_09195 [Cetobacterium sp.]
MKIAILLKAVSSLQAHNNDLSRFNDRKYGTWKAKHNAKLC